MENYVFTARNINADNSFGDDPDDHLHYLIIPDTDNAGINPIFEVEQKQWLLSILTSFDTTIKVEDVLILVHGYNNSLNDVLTNHNVIKSGLGSKGYKGKVVSFDWPCQNSALMYLPDRHKAKETAMQLVNGGIALLVQQQQNNCTINVHVLAHSTGAYVVREAFDDADDTNTVQSAGTNNNINVNASNWMVTQMIFIEGDISSSSMARGGDCDSISRHIVRLTNYYNPYDKVLALSNIKRAGFENRAGRIGLPANAAANYVDVNCGPYFKTIEMYNSKLAYSHSWYFDQKHNDTFIKDLYFTIQGEIDRNYIPTRNIINNVLQLKAD